MKRIRNKTLILLCTVVVYLLYAGSAVYSLETVSIFGRLVDYAWANNSSRLAVMFIDTNESNVIFVIEAARGTVTGKYFLPENVEYNSFDWTSSDDGFILCGPKVDEYPSGSIFRFNTADRSFSEVYTDIERGYVYIDNIATEGGTGRWAAAYSGEGHPDVYFYQEDTLLIHTDVYPGIITLVDWNDGGVFCMSDIRIDYGLTQDEREENYSKSDEAEKGVLFHESVYYADERLRLYKIDPESGNVTISDEYYKDILGTSADGSNYVKFDQINLPDTDFYQLTVTFF